MLGSAVAGTTLHSVVRATPASLPTQRVPWGPANVTVSGDSRRTRSNQLVKSYGWLIPEPPHGLAPSNHSSSIGPYWVNSSYSWFM